jgi:hypothetical protein
MRLAVQQLFSAFPHGYFLFRRPKPADCRVSRPQYSAQTRNGSMRAAVANSEAKLAAKVNRRSGRKAHNSANQALRPYARSALILQ